MTKWIAHRGVSSVAPENTLAAFTLAWAHDVDGIECDIQVTKDDVVVVHHDANTKRCSSQAYIIADHDYARLSDIDVGSFKDIAYADERMPTLQQVLQNMPSGKTIQVEIKPDVVKISPIIAALKAARKDIDLIVMSFNADLLQQITQACPQLPSLWILDKETASRPDIFQRAQAFGFDGVDVNYRVIDEDYVSRAHQHQLLLGAWTVNDHTHAQQLIAWGVDMLASDYPPTLLERTTFAHTT